MHRAAASAGYDRLCHVPTLGRKTPLPGWEPRGGSGEAGEAAENWPTNGTADV